MMGSTKGVGLQRETEAGIAGDSAKIKSMLNLVFDTQQVLQESIKKFQSCAPFKHANGICCKTG